MYKQAYPDKRGDAVTDEVVKIWRDTLEKGKNEEKYRLFLARLERRVDKVSGNNIRACFVKQRNVEKMEVEMKEDEVEVKQGDNVDIDEVEKKAEAFEEEKKIAEKKRKKSQFKKKLTKRSF